MPDNEKDNLTVQECTVSQKISMKVKGINVTIQFATERNDMLCKQVKKMLLTSYLSKKA